MTLDEAIQHCEEVASKCEFDTDWGMGNHFIDRSGVADVIECAKEHRQLAEWLNELKALKEKEPCDDCISRQAVLEKLRTCYDTETKEYSDGSQWINYEDAVAEMENLPPVTPQPKTGHWIDRFPAKECKCSVCDFLICISNGSYIDMVGQMKYCPNCGADMRGDEAVMTG